jgi:hypothetical protein
MSSSSSARTAWIEIAQTYAAAACVVVAVREDGVD